VLAITKSLPMEKRDGNSTKTLTPKIMFRYAPGKMRDLSGEGTNLNTNNLFAINKTGEIDVVENGISAIYGLDYNIDTINKKGESQNKISLSVGQVISAENNNNMSKTASLNRKMSDIVSEINYNFLEDSSINYKFALDNNFDNLNYNQIATNFNFSKVNFNLDYLEEQNHVGNENYINSGLTIDFDEFNSLNFKTRKNFQTNSTEFYNLSYQYINDCLTAGIEFKRDFYSDRDIEPTDTLRFTITIIPLSRVDSPSFSNF